MRSCIGCRARQPRELLVRVVCSPEGEILVDRHLKAPGRGAHLCYDAGCVEAAVKRRAFGRAFKSPVTPVDAAALIESIRASVEARIDDALRIGRPAGWTMHGADVLEREAARLLLLVVATDAAEATVAKLTAIAARAGCALWRYGDRASLGSTQGRELIAGLGVTARAPAERLARELGWRRQLGTVETDGPGLRDEGENQ